MTEFYSKMKSYADEMTASGQTLGDEEFVVYVLTGLDEEIYNSSVSSIVTRVEPISPAELYSQMLTFELWLMKQAANTSYTSTSANAASRGRGGPWTHGGSPPWPRAVLWLWPWHLLKPVTWSLQQQQQLLQLPPFF
jgi:hypothetical protein